MADSGALRQKRYKACRRGDHRLCRHDRLSGPVPGEVQAAFPVRSLPEPQIRNAIADFDPAAEMRLLAVRLHEAYRADPSNAALARELRMTLLAVKAPDEDNELADLMRSLGEF